MRFVFILYILVPSLVLGHVSDSVRSEKRRDGLFVIHEVEEGETLYSLARRYKSSVQSIVRYNEIDDNRIEIGQLIEVLYGEVEAQKAQQKAPLDGNYHQVQEGETLYRISKRYDIKLKVLRKLNGLKDNSISPGQYLRLSNDSVLKEENVDTVSNTEEPNDSTTATNYLSQLTSIDFESYLVQTGETLASIAEKINVSVEKLMDWNDLTSTYIRIGQELKYVSDPVTNRGSNEKSTIDENGFQRIYEEGVAAEIGEITTSKYLALHRSLPIGTELEVRNLMNNLVVHVKVVGRLPDTGINEDIMLRLSPPAYNKLGILDPRSRVEVSYFK